jgi:hypothetical protein
MWYCDDPVQRTILQSSVVKACWGLDDNLQKWLKEAGPLKEFHDANGMLVDQTSSDDLVLAHMTLLYWTAYIILYSTLIAIYDPSLSDVPANLDPRPYIQKIAKALPYFWIPGAGLSGANLAALPWGMCLHITYTAPHRYQEESALMEQLVMHPSVEQTVLGFLNSLHKTTARPEMAKVEGKQGMVRNSEFIVPPFGKNLTPICTMLPCTPATPQGRADFILQVVTSNSWFLIDPQSPKLDIGQTTAVYT